jgi:hypothetical protein
VNTATTPTPPPPASAHRTDVDASEPKGWRLTLRHEPDAVPGPVRLRGALKALLRVHHLRCVAVEVIGDPDPARPHPPEWPDR